MRSWAAPRYAKVIRHLTTFPAITGSWFSSRSSNTPGTWKTRLLGGYFRKWVILGCLIGVVAGAGAIAFSESIALATRLLLTGVAGIHPPVTRGEGLPVIPSSSRSLLLPLVTTLGGLLSGIIVFSLAPEAEGHGTDAAIKAFHEHGGRIRSRIPLVKLAASAITIGSGGSAGREGPTAQIAAGFGSWLGSAFGLSAADRRIALAVGVGAGIGAIFKAPLGGAILAGEILYLRDFELGAIIPSFVASVVGYVIFATWSGWTPVFGEGAGLRFDAPQQLPWYAVLGLCAGVAGLVYVRVFYAVRDLFARLRIPRFLKPAIGGLCVGVLGLFFPQVLSMGYGWLQFAIDGDRAHLAVGAMLALVVVKIVATSLTIGSGGSGGVFAPGLFIGGMLGGGLWGVLHGRVGWLPPVPAPFVIVGMMALFGGVAKAPIAVMLMVAEMTGEFSMIVPAMLATSIAYFVTGKTSIYENQVPTRADSPAHRAEYRISLMTEARVRDAMRRFPVVAFAAEPVEAAEARMAAEGIRGLPVLDEARQLRGMFTMTDALGAARDGARTVGDAMTRDPIVAYPEESLHAVLKRMTGANVSRLPVVERGKPYELAGVVSIRDVAARLDVEVQLLEAAKANLDISI